MAKKKLSNKQLISIFGLIFVLIANIFVAMALISLWRFSNLDKITFLAISGVIICVLLILDVIFFVGYLTKDNRLKLINFILAIFIVISSIFANYLLSRVNSAFSNMTSNSGIDQFENIAVSFVAYNNDDINTLEDLDKALVGIDKSVGVSPSTLGKQKLNEAKISPHYVEYNGSTELFLGLISGEINCAILPSGYKALFEDSEGYSEYLDNTKVIAKFDEKIKTGENQSYNLDLTKKAFNVLLIGYAPESDTYGLADAIILATVNPKSMTVTLTSVPRDTYVEIAGTGGKQKINAARGISRQCLVDTVSNLLDTDIDFYMEINFKGIVDIVDALGGIWIESPIEFVGQDPSTDRGNYTVWVAKGGQWANGAQALAFARERKQMPNGDYDRQLHQQQVITQIVSRLLELNDLGRALNALEAAGNNFETNISVEQLTGLFNYLLKVPNFTGMDTMKIIEIQNMRVTGVDSHYYDKGEGKPLWIMVPYPSSIKENHDRILKTLGESEYDLDERFDFSALYPFYGLTLYHDYFNEAVDLPEMPNFVPDFIKSGSTVHEIKNWADQNSLMLQVIEVGPDDSRYVEGARDLVVDMSPAYGTLISDLNGVFTIYVSGLESSIEQNIQGSVTDEVPDFTFKTVAYAKAWCEANDYTLHISYILKDSQYYNEEYAGLIANQSIFAGTATSENYEIEITVFEESSITEPDTNPDGPTDSDQNTGANPYDIVGADYATAHSWCQENGYFCIFYDQDHNRIEDGYVSDLWGEIEGGSGLWFVMEGYE